MATFLFLFHFTFNFICCLFTCVETYFLPFACCISSNCECGSWLWCF